MRPIKQKKTKRGAAIDPARVMERDCFVATAEKLHALAQTKNTNYISQSELIERFLPDINTALTNGHRLDEIFAVLQAEGVPLTRLLTRDIRKRLNMPQPRQRKRPTLRAVQSAGPDAA